MTREHHRIQGKNDADKLKFSHENSGEMFFKNYIFVEVAVAVAL